MTCSSSARDPRAWPRPSRREAGLDYEVLEKGVLVDSIFHFPRQMTFFTTPDLLEIGGLPFVTPYEKPTQGEALRYYRARGRHLRAADRARRGGLRRSRREGDGFRSHARARRAARRARVARTWSLATGYYDHPNRLGVPGEDLPHVSHYYDEPHPFYRKRVVVVGGKNSAAIAALELYRAGATVTLVHRARGARRLDQVLDQARHREPDQGRRRSRRASRRGWCEIRADARVVVTGPRATRRSPADAVFLLTGYHPDVELLRGAGVRVDPETLKPGARSRHPRDQRARPLRRRRRGLRPRDQPHLQWIAA